MRLLLPVLFTYANALLLPNIKRLDDSATETSEIAARNGTEDNPGNTEVAGAAPETSAGNDSTSSMYIVVLKKEKEEAEYEEHEQWVLNQFSELRKRKREEGSGVEQEVEFFNVSSFHGYAGEIPESLLNTIRENPLVDFVEQDSRAQFASITTQNNAPWGLSRISRRPRDPTQGLTGDYRYDTEGGRGVTVFVLDSGIRVTDPEFEARARWGTSVIHPPQLADNIGHGTHVARIIGSRTYGVAKQVDLVAVQVAGPVGGYTSDIIRGVQYVVREHRKVIGANTSGFKGSIINISIVNELSRALDSAVNAAVRAGVSVVVAAGNQNSDACNFSPARATGVITVAAIGQEDEHASFSNYGRCVDIHAPEDSTESSGVIGSPRFTSGTSQAAAHVSGLLAYLLSLQPDQGSGFSGKRVLPPAVIRRMLFDLASRDLVTGLPPNTANLLAYNGAQSPLAQVLDLVGPGSADSGDVPV